MLKITTRILFICATFLGGYTLSGIFATSAISAIDSTTPMPEFTQDTQENWINTTPLKKEDLKGKVVLIDVWTYECWNCYRSFPWLKDLEKRYEAQGFEVIGIHSPEFKHERDKMRVARKVKEFGLTNPVMIDNDFRYWKALNNRYWPSFYLVDRQGNIRFSFVGEMHKDTDRAEQVDKIIEILLQEEAE